MTNRVSCETKCAKAVFGADEMFSSLLLAEITIILCNRHIGSMQY